MMKGNDRGPEPLLSLFGELNVTTLLTDFSEPCFLWSTFNALGSRAEGKKPLSY